MEFMKGMYLIWPDNDYIDKAIDSGINKFFFAMQHATKDIIESVFEKYSDKVEIIPMECFIDGRALPRDQQFVHKGQYLEHTPCPTCKEFIKERFRIPLEMYNKYDCRSIAIDLECYGNGPGFISYFRDWEESDYLCECDRCKKFNYFEQHTINANLIGEVFGDAIIHQLCYVNPYIWRTTDYWLNEFTYEEWGVWQKILKNTRKMKKDYDATTKNSSGLWMEKFTADDYLKCLKKIVKATSNDGYWLYPQMRMSKNCFWRTHPDDPYSKRELANLPYHSFIDAPNDNTSDTEFFIKLKELNNNIDDYRSGWWFGLRKWISGWFR